MEALIICHFMDEEIEEGEQRDPVARRGPKNLNNIIKPRTPSPHKDFNSIAFENQKKNGPPSDFDPFSEKKYIKKEALEEVIVEDRKDSGSSKQSFGINKDLSSIRSKPEDNSMAMKNIFDSQEENYQKYKKEELKSNKSSEHANISKKSSFLSQRDEKHVSEVQQQSNGSHDSKLSQNPRNGTLNAVLGSQNPEGNSIKSTKFKKHENLDIDELFNKDDHSNKFKDGSEYKLKGKQEKHNEFLEFDD